MEHTVGGSDPAVEVAFVGADTFRLHLPDGGALVNGWQLLDPLALIAAVVDAAGKTFSSKRALHKSAHALRHSAKVSGLPQSVVGTALNT